jgi:hypothetical protein
MHLFEGGVLFVPGRRFQSNALTPHGLVRISNLMAFDWFQPNGGLSARQIPVAAVAFAGCGATPPPARKPLDN